MAGVYVHLPFCPYICPYCDFAKWPMRASDAVRYLAALHAEIALCVPAAARTLFFGGGTPNTYDAAAITAVIIAVRERFSLPDDAEISVECNPDVRLCEQFDAYRAAGVNRLSFGVQSFIDTELRLLGRQHSAEDVAEAVRRARSAGIANVSLDLIFGVPGQTDDSWRRSLDAALELGPDHLSTYGLTIEEGTPYAAWRASEPAAFPDDDAAASMYEAAMRTLSDAGFEQYEISNFAKPGRRCEHNANYWENGDYLGFGVSAATYRGGTRSVNVRDLRDYLTAIEGGESATSSTETLPPDDRVGEALMLALRTAAGINAEKFESLYGVNVFRRNAREIGENAAAGLIRTDGRTIALTFRGRCLANVVCAAFLTDDERSPQ